MSRIQPLQTVLIFLVASAGMTPAVADTQPHARDGFVLGFQLGIGAAAFEEDGAAERAGSVAGGTAGLALGWAVDPAWVLGAEWNGWNNESSGVKQSISFTSFQFAWYPKQGGFHLDGAAGWIRARFRTPLAVGGRDVDADGPGVGVGVGYEWRLTRSFALGCGVDLVYGPLDGATASWANLSLGFRWYL